MSEPPVDENEPGPPRPLSDFMSPERFAEFNAETRRLRRESLCGRKKRLWPRPQFILRIARPVAGLSDEQPRLTEPCPAPLAPMHGHVPRARSSVRAVKHANRQENRSAPDCVNLTNVPLSCSANQPRSITRSRPAFVFLRRGFVAKQERPVDQLDVDPAVLHDLDAVGVSTILRAAFSGSEYGRSEANFICHP